MKQTEICWICGASGAGKDTFIRKVHAEASEKIIKRFGWEGMNIIPCKESLEWVAIFDGDSLELKRNELPSVIESLAQPNSVILIKGQVADLTTGLPKQLKKMLPEAKHRIFFIDAPLDELFERCKQKEWFKQCPWYRKSSKREMAKWRSFQLDLLKKIAPEFEIKAIDGSDKGSYEFIKIPL